MSVLYLVIAFLCLCCVYLWYLYNYVCVCVCLHTPTSLCCVWWLCLCGVCVYVCTCTCFIHVCVVLYCCISVVLWVFICLYLWRWGQMPACAFWCLELCCMLLCFQEKSALPGNPPQHLQALHHLRHQGCHSHSASSKSCYSTPALLVMYYHCWTVCISFPAPKLGNHTQRKCGIEERFSGRVCGGFWCFHWIDRRGFFVCGGGGGGTILWTPPPPCQWKWLSERESGRGGVQWGERDRYT